MRTRWVLAVCALLGACEPSPLESDGGATPIDAPPPVCELEIEAEPPLADPALHTPRWAFEPWISKDISDREDTFEFVAGFRERGIPVGAIVLDSPWDTHYTTFRPSPTRYPDFGEMVERLHARTACAWCSGRLRS